MKALLIEDDELKFELLAGFFREELPAFVVERAASYQSGVAMLVTNTFDLVILDMTLPVSDLARSPVGMEWLNFGGQFVLRECKRRKLNPKIVVVSQYKAFVRNDEEVSFEKLRGEILEQYAGLVIDCLHLDRTADNWRQQILELINV